MQADGTILIHEEEVCDEPSFDFGDAVFVRDCDGDEWILAAFVSFRPNEPYRYMVVRRDTLETEAFRDCVPRR